MLGLITFFSKNIGFSEILESFLREAYVKILLQFHDFILSFLREKVSKTCFVLLKGSYLRAMDPCLISGNNVLPLIEAFQSYLFNLKGKQTNEIILKKKKLYVITLIKSFLSFFLFFSVLLTNTGELYEERGCFIFFSFTLITGNEGRTNRWIRHCLVGEKFDVYVCMYIADTSVWLA